MGFSFDTSHSYGLRIPSRRAVIDKQVQNSCKLFTLIRGLKIKFELGSSFLSFRQIYDEKLLKGFQSTIEIGLLLSLDDGLCHVILAQEHRHPHRLLGL